MCSIIWHTMAFDFVLFIGFNECTIFILFTAHCGLRSFRIVTNMLGKISSQSVQF